jgi:hypothetical protein
MGPKEGGIFILTISVVVEIDVGAHDSVVVQALCYKPKGRGFET